MNESDKSCINDMPVLQISRTDPWAITTEKEKGYIIGTMSTAVAPCPNITHVKMIPPSTTIVCPVT